jgi:hypothetical protein
MLVKQLNATNPEREDELWRDYRALYEGGREFHARAHRFLLQNSSEPYDLYHRRCKDSIYRSYIGAVIDYFASQLFAVPILYKPDTGEVPEWFTDDFETDCDGQGTDILEFLRVAFIDALVTQTATVFLDFPENYGQAESKFAADEIGATDVRLKLVPRCHVLDWERDRRGRLQWWIATDSSKPRETPADKRNSTRHEWIVADRGNVQLYRAEVEDGKQLDDESTLVPVVEIRHPLKSVPVIELTVDDGLWVANRLESAQIEHFRLSSGLSWSIKRTCYAMPLFKVADPESFTPGNMGAGYYLVIKNDEDATFMAPPVSHLAITSEQIKDQKDEIFRLVSQLALGVDNNAASVGRSGESKIADAEAIRVVLRAYAALVRDFLKSILNALSEARGEATKWTVEGLDKFETLGPETLVGLLKESLALGIPSRTFRVEAKYRAAVGVLPGTDEEQRKKIRDEIEDGIDEEDDREDELNAIARGVGAGAPRGPEADRGDRGPATSADEEADQDGARGGREGGQKGSPAVPRGPGQRSTGERTGR